MIKFKDAATKWFAIRVNGGPEFDERADAARNERVARRLDPSSVNTLSIVLSALI
jgi:hypothetical protein